MTYALIIYAMMGRGHFHLEGRLRNGSPVLLCGSEVASSLSAPLEKGLHNKASLLLDLLLRGLFMMTLENRVPNVGAGIFSEPLFMREDRNT